MFALIHKDKSSRARLGKLETLHGEIETPCFMPVATKGAVKTLTSDEVSKLGYQIILANTYHLLERPGVDLIEAHSGLHSFMAWDGAILTDSGGYQVHSLSRLTKVYEEGVSFRSLIDGKEVFLSPELVLQWQKRLSSDISMVLDVCLPYGVDKKKSKEAYELTLRWALRSRQVEMKEGQQVFGIVQGNFYKDHRRDSAIRTVEIGFDGYAIGGLSVGEPEELMWEMAEVVIENLPEDAPRYMMGVGDPIGVLKGISLGIDMFDSALPTRIARGGVAFTRSGKLNIRNSKYVDDNLPLEEGCECFVCSKYSRAYIRHLYLSDETLALRLLTYHNLFFMMMLLREVKKAIKERRLSAFMKEFQEGFLSGVIC